MEVIACCKCHLNLGHPVGLGHREPGQGHADPLSSVSSLQSNLLSWLRKYDVFSPASIMNWPQANRTITYIHSFGHMHGHVDKGTPFWKIKKWKPSWTVCNQVRTYKSSLEQIPTHDLCLPFVCKKTLVKHNLRSEKIQKEIKTVKQDKVIIL